MTRALSIDFVQMPWSRSPASWQYYEEDVWGMLQDAVDGSSRRIRVHGEASANDHLSGMLDVSLKGFKASVSIKGGDGATLAHGALEEPQHYFKDLAACVKAGDGEITATVEVRFPEAGKARMDLLLNTLWDLQLYALHLLDRTTGIPDDSITEHM